MKFNVLLALLVCGVMTTVLLAQTPRNSAATKPAGDVGKITPTTAPTSMPASAPTTEPASAPSRQDMSYGIGYQSGKRFLREIQMNGVDIDIPSMMEGLQDAFASKPSRLPESQMQASLEAAQRQAEATQQNRMKEAQAQRAQQAEKNKTEGEAFLAANAQREGVKVTESGLQYEVIHQGDGPRPQPTDQVTVNYRGTLIDGTEFDSSAKHGKPAQFRLDRVIKGWTEGVGLMSVGSKYKFFIPSDLAYGLMAPPQIGPNATLLFEVELLDIAHEAPAPGAASAPSAGAASKPAK